MDQIATEEWIGTDNETRQEELEDIMAYTLIGYGNALQGKEVPLTLLKGLLHFWEEIAMNTEPFIMTILYGKFKGEDDHRWHCLPIPDRTRTGILARK